MKNMTLSNIAKACGGRLIAPDDKKTFEISGVAIDSRKVKEGFLFIPIKGARVDGHDFIPAVFEAGAAAALSERELLDCPGPYILVNSTETALKEIAAFYRSGLDLTVIGISGSVGKTSTKEMIASILEQHFSVLKTEGNFNNEIGLPLTVFRLREEHEIAVLEMGISDFGEMHRLAAIARPDLCVITNIGQCHLENLKTRDGILKAKSEIFDFMAEDGEICLNGEDDKLRGLTEVKGRRPHFFGLGGNPAEEVTAEKVQSQGLWGSNAVLRLRQLKKTAGRAEREVMQEEEVPVHVPLPGIHMVTNAAAAACVAGLFGLSCQEIVRGIEKIQPVDGRNHLIRLPGFTLIDDCYNANPASMRAAIDLLAMADTKKVAILGDMFELGENSAALHAGVGEYAASADIDVILCVGENSRNTFRKAAEHGKGKIQVTHFPDRETLLKALDEKPEEYIPKGSTVLIKASHGMEFVRVLEFLREKGALM